LEGPGITPFWIVQAMLIHPGPLGAGGATVALLYCCAHIVESHNVIPGAVIVCSGTVTLLLFAQPFASVAVTLSPTSPVPSAENITFPDPSLETIEPCVADQT
jgi:hypothetical protein